jgi:hypothetical protein
MSQIAVDTGVASYIFNWHSSAQRYAYAPLALNNRSFIRPRCGQIS